MKPIWIVDDDESIRWVLEKALARENLSTRSFSNVRDVVAALDSGTPQVLVSDIRMPGESGLELLQIVKERFPGLPVIVMTAFSDLDSAVSAFQGGAFEYLAKPFDLDKAVELIRRALEESLRESAGEATAAETPEILGQAAAMQDVFRAIGRLSQSNEGDCADMQPQAERQQPPVGGDLFCRAIGGGDTGDAQAPFEFRDQFDRMHGQQRVDQEWQGTPSAVDSFPAAADHDGNRQPAAQQQGDGHHRPDL